MKIVIVGGVAGGAAAATRARRLSEEAEIVLFERGPNISFVNCGLPYYVGGLIDDRDKLLAATPESMRERYRLDVRIETAVEAIDRARKTVRAVDRTTGRVYDEAYDKLILAPGAGPIRPQVPGIDLDGICTLRDLGDVDRIKARVDAGVKRAVVIGGGYIGLEMVENLVRRGVATTLIQSRDQVLASFDKEMTAPIAQELVKHGVELVLSEPVVGFSRGEDGRGLAVEVESGRRFTADLVILGVGVKPETWLAEGAGLMIGPEGGIQVNEHLQTVDPDIYAVGDAIEVEDVVLGGSTRVPLAGPANRQGRLVAEHIFGRAAARYRGSQGTIIVGVFSRTAGATGATEQVLRKAGKAYRKVYIHANNHSGYIPGAEPITLKLVFDPEGGRVLGGQAVGGEGVDKRIDVLATAIQARMTVFDLEEAELAYAPQYGAANDLVNMAGFTAGGLIRGEHPQVDVEAVLAAPPERKPFLLDVRTPNEFAADHIPGAVNIPLDDLRDRLAELPRDQLIAAYCRTGKRSYIAIRILLQHGYHAANIGGGFKTYKLHRPDGKPS